ncbi:MAG: hypothetical protein GTO61_13510 [Gemmatimonadales bacterium]|nr:hypothetical protein [Gemmatimonadales bacterium]
MGRLWVVCRRCERWNLTPLEERWEAVEDCERRFRDARKRVTSENIGLARLEEGLELVRIGNPLRPEFAAWRYGDQFGRRRRRALGTAVGAAAFGGALAVGWLAPALVGGGAWWGFKAAEAAVTSARRRRLIARVPITDGATLTVRGEHLEHLRLRPDLESEEGWSLELPHEEGGRILKGANAVNAAAVLMPRVNLAVTSPRAVEQAVRLLESFDDPVRYLLAAAHVADAKAPGWKVVPRLPLKVRLAIEMAVNEENERFALEGELALLELDWKEAEEIAAIADTLLIPAEVEEQLEKMRRQSAR